MIETYNHWPKFFTVTAGWAGRQRLVVKRYFKRRTAFTWGGLPGMPGGSWYAELGAIDVYWYGKQP